MDLLHQILEQKMMTLSKDKIREAHTITCYKTCLIENKSESNIGLIDLT